MRSERKKRLFLKSVAALIACMMILLSVVGCSSSGKTMMKLGDNTISVNMFELFMSRMKGTLCSSYYYGADALEDSFWDKIMSANTTYNSFYKAKVLNDVKSYLAALSLFDELGLKLPDSYIEDIDEELDSLIENDAEGSKSTFNSMLAAYGANYKILREAYIIEAKISYLKDYLYGSNGSNIGTEMIEEYYQENYARFKQIFLYTYGIVYETDSDGNEIYYTSDKRIAYDTTKVIKKDESGNRMTDSNGDFIYVNEDGSIAYDTKNGTRACVYDEKGNIMTREYTEEELRETSDRAQIIYEEKTVDGDFKLFDTLVANYGEDAGMDDYPNGYYMTENSNYDSPEVVKALFEMEVGEIRLVRSDYGIHIIMRYELDAGGYADEDNSDFFISTNTGAYVFMSDLISSLFAEKLSTYTEKIVIDEVLLAGVDMKSVGANFYY